MESKTRLWRRKLSGKTITKERVLDLERSLKNLNEQLSSTLNESDTKDDLIDKQTKVAEEAIAGWEKAEAEAVSFKLELDDALYQKAIVEEKVTSIDAALKECAQQLHALKDEQKRTTNESTVNMLQEQEKTRISEERLADANKRLQQLSLEKTNLCGILDMKEKLIKDLNVSKSQSEADFAAIVERFDFSEKINESLKYEVLMLQKELVIRNQEREFNLRSAESAQKQHLENVRKINRLESECHRLRVMVRKRLPGPAAIAKMRSEVEMLGNSAPETRRNLSYTMDSSYDFTQEIGHDALSKQGIRLHGIEDENKILKENLKKKNSELQLSRIMFARTASKLSQAEKQLKELSKGPTCLELARSSSVTYELPLASVSEDGGNKDDASCSESWASALMSQLEHFRIGKPAMGSSQSSLMDDFEEMEKLAIVCADKPEEGLSIEEPTFQTPKSVDLKPDLLESMSKELVPLNKLSNSGHGDQSCFTQYEKYPTWLQDILKVIAQKRYTTQLSLDVMLHEVRAALNKNKTTVKGKPLDPLLVGDNACQGPHHSSFTSADGLLGMKNFLPSETAELRTLKDSRGLAEVQKPVSQDLGTQLTSAKVELNETRQKFSSLEAELEEKSNCCEELKATCIELQLQIASVSNKDIPKFDMVLEEKELRTDWEISAASEKLVECQETILQLGKQLKALASPKSAALFDNMISSPAISRNSPSPQFVEQLIAIDNAKFEDLKSPQTKEIICSEPQKTDASFLNGLKGSVHFVSKNQESSIKHDLAKSPDRSYGELGGPCTQKCGTEVGALVSIPKKQKGGISLLKKLLSRKKKTAIRSWP